MTAYSPATPTFYTKSARIPYTATGSTRVYKFRSYIQNRATIFGIGTGVMNTSWGVKRLINLKFHSSQTWKALNPHLTRASTDILLTRTDAEAIVVALMSAIAEYDRQEEEESV